MKRTLRCRRSSVRRIAVTVILLFLGGNAAPAQNPKAIDDYRAGLNALQDQRFADAETYFRDAISKRADERSGRGMRNQYMPFFFLGMALAEQKRCAEAFEAWAQSEGQGQIQQTEDLLPRLEQRKQQCQEEMQALEEARSTAREAVYRARKAASTVQELGARPDLQDVWNVGDPSLEQRYNDADRKLRGATAMLEGALPNDLDTFQSVTREANAAAESFGTLTSDVDAQLAEIHDQASSALDRLQSAEARGHSAIQKVQGLSPYPPGVGRAVAALEAALAQTVAEKAAAGPGELATLRSNLTQAIGALNRIAVAPPQSLRAAAEAFLGGDYAKAIADLDAQDYDDPRAARQACLLRAASRHALCMLAGCLRAGGNEDAEPATGEPATGESAAGEPATAAAEPAAAEPAIDIDLAAALEADVTACLALDPAPEVVNKYFSPSFVQYYQAAASASNEDAGKAAEESSGGS